MASFKISRDESGKHTWKATGTNPKTGKEMIIRGGQAGTKVGKNNPDSEKTFDARHNATGMTPKKYINKLRWDNKGKFGSSVSIPDELFGKTASKKTASKKGATKKAASKKTASKKGSPKKSSPRKSATKKAASKKGATKSKSKTS